MVLGIVGRDYNKKNRVLEYLAKVFGLAVSVPLNKSDRLETIEKHFHLEAMMQ